MPTIVTLSDTFIKQLRKLTRKYPLVVQDVEELTKNLQNDARPGDQIPDIGYEVYKVRLRNRSAKRGKSGGFRVIYFVRLEDEITLLTIYSKTDQADISLGQIGHIVEQVMSQDNDNNDIE